MTDTTVTCGMWRGVTTPEGWVPPFSDAMPGMFGKLASKTGKDIGKYASACAMALELSADGLTRDGKALKEADLFLLLAEAHAEALAIEAARKAEADKARAEALAKAQRMTTLEATIKEAQVKGGITFEMMQAWANVAHESGAYLTMHGGTDNGAGIAIRFKVDPKQASATPRAARETGNGSKGGKETRVSAYAEALRFQAKGGAPHNITRTGSKEAGYTYFDHGKEVKGLNKYLQSTYPTSPCGISLKGYDDRRKEARANDDTDTDE